MFYVLCVLVMVLCTGLAIRTRRLLMAALWLAASSAAVAVFLYVLGAHEIAVIELSVGTGLVPVLFVFAISVMGNVDSLPPPIIPRFVTYGLVLVCASLLGMLVLPLVGLHELTPSNFSAFTRILWGERGLDMLVQIVVIFAGVLSILNLLAAIQRPVKTQSARLTKQQPEVDHPVSESILGKERV